MTDLFTIDDLSSYMQVPSLDLATAVAVRRAASGWLADATGLAEWPVPVPDRLWAWALELAAMAYLNPTWAERETVGGVTTQWGDLAVRRREILTAARQALRTTSGAVAYSFPSFLDWPDSVERRPVY